MRVARTYEQYFHVVHIVSQFSLLLVSLKRKSFNNVLPALRRIAHMCATIANIESVLARVAADACQEHERVSPSLATQPSSCQVHYDQNNNHYCDQVE
jgi:hypothetical protein